MGEFLAFALAFGIGAGWGAWADGGRDRTTTVCFAYPVAWTVLVGIHVVLSALIESWNPPGRTFVGNLYWGAVFAMSFSLASPLGCWCVMRSLDRRRSR